MEIKKGKLHIDLEEALEVLDKIHEKARQRMVHGTRVHGTEMVRRPFEELEEELADAFNYITLGFIKTLKSCGGYRGKWELKKLPDVQKRRITHETERKKSCANRVDKRNR